MEMEFFFEKHNKRRKKVVEFHESQIFLLFCVVSRAELSIIKTISTVINACALSHARKMKMIRQTNEIEISPSARADLRCAPTSLFSLPFFRRFC